MDAYENELRLAFAAHERGDQAAAETLCRKLLRESRADSRPYYLLGVVLHQRERFQEALDYLRQASALAPQAPAIFKGLGCAWQSLGNYSEAADNFRRAVALKPDRADLYDGLGHACFELGDIEAAEAAFRRAVELDPQNAESWNNLGKTLRQLNRLDEAIAAYGRALELRPELVLAHYGRALALLAAGDLPAGLREYEWRPHRTPREFPQPRWRGEALAGRTLFLHAEQGFGDAIQAVRFIPRLRAQGARVILECRPRLKRLFVFSNCADVVIAREEPIPPFDCYTSALSVAGILGVTLETIPKQVPYLSAPPANRPPGGKPRIGLVWAGNPGHNDDALRSIPLAELAPVLNLPGYDFFSLQVPVPAGDGAVLAGFPQLVNAGNGLLDFMDTATAIAGMDLVITVDTAVAHLAGALGKPVWLLLAHSPDWRWFRQCGDQSPWYPTMRLFRQPRRGQWGPVVARVAEELKQGAAAAGAMG
jgi:Flp pilus assembly protein TadD